MTSVTELHDLDGSFAKMVVDGNAVLYLPIWVKNDPYERLDYDLAELLYRYKMSEITAASSSPRNTRGIRMARCCWRSN